MKEKHNNSKLVVDLAKYIIYYALFPSILVYMDGI